MFPGSGVEEELLLIWKVSSVCIYRCVTVYLSMLHAVYTDMCACGCTFACQLLCVLIVSTKHSPSVLEHHQKGHGLELAKTMTLSLHSTQTLNQSHSASLSQGLL